MAGLSVKKSKAAPAKAGCRPGRALLVEPDLVGDHLVEERLLEPK
jgi:hypothetical protein